MTLQTDVTLKLVATQLSSLDLADGKFPLSIAKILSMATGTSSGQADLLFADQRTIAASGSENLDLTGSLTDAFGTTLTFAAIKLLYVYAAATNTNNVNVSSDGTNGVPMFLALGDGVKVVPGGMQFWTAPGAGIAVTASTGDLLTFANSSSGTSVTYDVVIIGTSS